MADETTVLQQERNEILERYERWFETPLIILGFLWLILLVVEFTKGLSPFLQNTTTAIWIIFILDFVLRFSMAPRKTTFIKANWLTGISLVIPALRVFRFARAVRLLRATRTARGVRLIRIVTSVNRGMRALGASMQRRGFGYVVALTIIVTLGGAAGMYTFENARETGKGLESYGTALWWTSMIMTTMGSDYWPKTGEGRLLCLLLSLYAFAVFGYLTAALASYFVGRDAESDTGEVAGTQMLLQLQQEVRALRTEIQNLSSHVSKNG